MYILVPSWSVTVVRPAKQTIRLRDHVNQMCQIRGSMKTSLNFLNIVKKPLLVFFRGVMIRLLSAFLNRSYDHKTVSIKCIKYMKVGKFL